MVFVGPRTSSDKASDVEDLGFEIDPVVVTGPRIRGIEFFEPLGQLFPHTLAAIHAYNMTPQKLDLSYPILKPRLEVVRKYRQLSPPESNRISEEFGRASQGHDSRRYPSVLI